MCFCHRIGGGLLTHLTPLSRLRLTDHIHKDGEQCLHCVCSCYRPLWGRDTRMVRCSVCDQRWPTMFCLKHPLLWYFYIGHNIEHQVLYRIIAIIRYINSQYCQISRGIWCYFFFLAFLQYSWGNFSGKTDSKYQRTSENFLGLFKSQNKSLGFRMFQIQKH